MSEEIPKYEFLTKLNCDVFDSKKHKIQLTKELRAMTAFGLVIVPVGFISDFASIPWWIRWLIPKMGKYNRSSVVHDFLYQYGRLRKDDPHSEITQEVADLIYKKLMEAQKVANWRKWTQWKGLRIGGFKQWKEYRGQDSDRYAHEVDPCR